ncbi:hypothetical protein EDC04DRAFT_645517 [Pisolithus marmoratus]|nr:hypothetical protein EDC04DRAFT_645517 [Pisolithus marmoratus]
MQSQGGTTVVPAGIGSGQARIHKLPLESHSTRDACLCLVVHDNTRYQCSLGAIAYCVGSLFLPTLTSTDPLFTVPFIKASLGSASACTDVIGSITIMMISEMRMKTSSLSIRLTDHGPKPHIVSVTLIWGDSGDEGLRSSELAKDNPKVLRFSGALQAPIH